MTMTTADRVTPQPDTSPVEPTPAQLWKQAEQEAKPALNRVWVRDRYLELMREHGYLIPREPGDDSPLFACGYDPSKRDD